MGYLIKRVSCSHSYSQAASWEGGGGALCEIFLVSCVSIGARVAKTLVDVQCINKENGSVPLTSHKMSMRDRFCDVNSSLSNRPLIHINVVTLVTSHCHMRALANMTRLASMFLVTRVCLPKYHDNFAAGVIGSFVIIRWKTNC